MIKAEDIRIVNEKLAKIDVKGKGYVQVNERIKGFRSICPNGNISTEIVSMENGIVTMKSTVTDDEGRVLGTGFAQEKETSSYINKTSYIENCETSAVGRALGFVGIGIDGSMASADEVANAIMNQGQPNEKQTTKKPTSAPHRQDTPEEAAKNEQMKASVDPVTLPTDDGKVTQEQWDKLKSEMERTGITEETLKATFSVNDLNEMTQGQVISAINRFKKTGDKP